MYHNNVYKLKILSLEISTWGLYVNKQESFIKQHIKKLNLNSTAFVS